MKKQWTISHIPDLTGKTMIITEGDNTLGYETAKTFALKGGVTVLACKNISMGQRIKEEIIKLNEKSIIEIMPLDLGDPKSIKEFAETFRKKYERLDVLVNINDNQTVSSDQSAKVFGKPFGSTPSGHFVLTALLLNKLASTPDSRVVNLSLGEHKLKPKDFNKLASKKGHGNSRKNKIGSSKWANLLFTYELQKFFELQKVNCKAVAAYPGPANRNLERRLKNEWYWRLFKPMYKMFTGPDPLESSLPGIRAALADGVRGGEYFGPNGFVEVQGYPSYNAVLQFVA
jgi:NAD(P)-dependent dehydrogenase (short-subunit alcohol dehydrogenase family)